MTNQRIHGTLCRYKNLPISSSSNKNDMTKVLHYNTVYFLGYTHLIYEMFIYKHTEIIYVKK